MSVLWDIDALISVMNARPVGELPSGIGGISIDTRSLQEGDAYFAIKGDVHDGHKFVGAAQNARAVIAVVAEEKLPALGSFTLPLLVVNDVLAALELLGQASRERSKAQIIAVTGSVGKTTTKEALRHVLSASGKVHASIASFNNHWGVPLTLARMPEDTQFGVFEIGMNHAGEISPLVKMVQPHIAVITNVEAVHLGSFADVDEIAAAKAEIFEGVVEDGAVVLNRDNAYYDFLTNLAGKSGIKQIVSFGEADGSHVQLSKLKLHDRCSCLMAKLFDEDIAVKIGVPGRHIAQNVLAVLAVAKLAGADMTKSALALADLQPEAGRGARHQLAIGRGYFTLIDESYNANLTSMRAAIAMLKASKPDNMGRRIAVLGDMLELGKKSGEMHGDLANEFSRTNIDQVFLVGPDMAHLRDNLPPDLLASYVADVNQLKPILFSSLQADDVVMVKASKGIGFAGLVDELVQKYKSKSDA
jgi:UDP-N-acetylmuramoyl-tripeptide--D-alanyl-D-alanine ligase